MTGPAPVPPPRRLSSRERRWARIAHAAAIPGMFIGLGFLGPIVVLLLVRRRNDGSAFIRHHVVQAVNFNVTIGIAATATFLALGLLAAAEEGGRPGDPQWGPAAALMVLLLLIVYWFMFTVRAIVSASYGERSRYPLTLPVLRT